MESAAETMAKATKALVIRTALTTGLMTLYSTTVLGNTLNMSVLQNSLLVGGSAAAAEGVMRLGIENLHILKANGANSLIYMGGESALAAGLYSNVVFPRAFPGADIPMTQLAIPAAACDLGAQILQPTLSKLLDPDQAAYN